jgi:hypothetical protein
MICAQPGCSHFARQDLLKIGVDRFGFSAAANARSPDRKL